MRRSTPKSFHLRLHHASRVQGLSTSELRKLIRFLMDRARQTDLTMNWSELDFVFTDNDGIRAYKQATFGIDEVTDVITQSYAPSPALPAWSGEVVINAERAREWGPRYGGAVRELALYLAHGCDHLTGGLDDTPSQRQAMRRREKTWLREAEKNKLLPVKPGGKKST